LMLRDVLMHTPSAHLFGKPPWVVLVNIYLNLIKNCVKSEEIKQEFKY